jgi:hypothetical protein
MEDTLLPIWGHRFGKLPAGILERRKEKLQAIMCRTYFAEDQNSGGGSKCTFYQYPSISVDYCNLTDFLRPIDRHQTSEQAGASGQNLVNHPITF